VGLTIHTHKVIYNPNNDGERISFVGTLSQCKSYLKTCNRFKDKFFQIFPLSEDEINKFKH